MRFPETRDELSAAGLRQETHIFLLSPTTLLLFLLGGRCCEGNPRDFQGKRRFQELIVDKSELKRPPSESVGCLSPRREIHLRFSHLCKGAYRTHSWGKGWEEMRRRAWMQPTG